MRYTEIIIYRRSVDGTRIDAYRQSTGGGYTTTVKVDIGKLYAGHTAWIREDIDARMERNSARRTA